MTGRKFKLFIETELKLRDRLVNGMTSKNVYFLCYFSVEPMWESSYTIITMTNNHCIGSGGVTSSFCVLFIQNNVCK